MFVLLRFETAEPFPALGRDAMQSAAEAMAQGFTLGIEPLASILRAAFDREVLAVRGMRVLDVAAEFQIRQCGDVDVFFFAFPARPPCTPLFSLNRYRDDDGNSELRFAVDLPSEFSPNWLLEYCRSRAAAAARKVTREGLPAWMARGFREICWAFRHLSSAPPIPDAESDGSPWIAVRLNSEDPARQNPAANLSGGAITCTPE